VEHLRFNPPLQNIFVSIKGTYNIINIYLFYLLT